MAPTARRPIALLTAVFLMMALGVPAAFAQEPVPFEDAEFNAFATGSTIQTFLVESGDTRLFQADAGFTGAAVDSEGLDGERRRALDNMVVVPEDAAGENSYARSSALEGGVGVEGGDPQDGQYMYAPDLVEASAPDGEDREEAGLSQSGDPLLYGEALFAEAEAHWLDDACLPFFSQGRSSTAYVELLDAAEMDNGDENGDEDNGTLEEPVVTAQVVESYSGTGLDAQLDADGNPTPETGAAAVYGDVRHEVVEIDFISGHTITLSSELRATASGTPGGAHVTHTLDLGITDPDGEPLPADLLEEILGGDPLDIELGDEEFGFLAQVTVDDEPTVEVSEDGTYAYGSWTPVSIRVLTDGDEITVAGLDVGFSEVEAEGPEGGIVCEVPMEKSVEPQSVEAGEEFTFTITVDNPYDCDITARVVDEISVEEGDPSWTVTGTDPEADEVSDDRVVWEDVTIGAGESAEFTIFAEADAGSAGGVLRNDAWLEDAVCEGLPLHGDADVIAGMPVVGDAFVVGPTIGEAAAAPAVLPTTGGGNAAALISLLLVAAALALRGRLFANSSESEREG